MFLLSAEPDDRNRVRTADAIETTDSVLTVDTVATADGLRTRLNDIFDSGYCTAVEGTGFGPAIVSEVVDAHGWSIDISESEAGGMRFDVSIPPGRDALGG